MSSVEPEENTNLSPTKILITKSVDAKAPVNLSSTERTSDQMKLLPVPTNAGSQSRCSTADKTSRNKETGSCTAVGQWNVKKLSGAWSDAKYDKGLLHPQGSKVSKRRNAVTTAQEAGFSEDILRKLAQIFLEADSSGKGSLDLEQFKEVMRKILTSGNVSEEEMELMYMKTDANCDGAVEFDEYLTFILLECKEKDLMTIQSQQPFCDTPRTVYTVNRIHKDSIVAVLYQKLVSKRKGDNLGRYITIGRDGIVICWNNNFEVTNMHKVQSDTKMVWLTGACIMASINLVAVCTTARTVSFFDITGIRFMELSRIVSLEACPTCIYYWSCPTDAERSVLLLGDDRGGITIIVFSNCPLQTNFNSKKMGTKKHIEKMHIASLIKDKISNVKAIYIPNVHADLVKQVKYVPHLGAFASCCKDEETAMCLATFDFRFERKVLKRFRVKQGVDTFDYCQHLNMIVTGGYDALIRVWNPYILSSPSSILYGHQSPLLFLKINSKKEHVISAAENKEIRIHDLNSQTCIQKFYKSMFLDLGKRMVSGVMFNSRNQDFIVATDTIMILEGRDSMWKDPESMSQLHPITSAIYNPLFHQVVSACWNGVVTVWDLMSGKIRIQFKAYKVKHKAFDAEITAMSFDPSMRRLITSSKNGCLRIWNFNNGEMLHELPNLENMEISALVWHKQRIITGGWSQRIMLLIEATEDYMIHILNPCHKEDIMSLACYRGNILASGCYNGDIYLWQMETGRMICAYNPTINKNSPLSPKEHTGQQMQNPIILPAKHIEKDQKKLQELTPLPCYLRANSLKACSTTTQTSDDKTESVVSMRDSMLSQAIPNSKYDVNVYKKFREEIKKDRKVSAPNAIEKIVFLENRDINPNNAVLLAASSDGIISAWSLHPTGGLKGTFQASSEINEPITAMIYFSNQEIVITGDFRGYIRVWDINHFCKQNSTKSCNAECQQKWQNFTFVEFKRKLYSSGRYHSIFPHLTNDYPHLIASFRGHLKTVTWLEIVPNVEGQELVISSSLDCSIRLWTLNGEFLGVYGQTKLWNLLYIDLPVWREGKYVNFEATKTKSMERRKSTVILPADVKKVASATTMTVMCAGKKKPWKKVQNVLRIIYKLRRRQRFNQKFKVISPIKTSDLVPSSSEEQGNQKPMDDTKELAYKYQQSAFDLDIPALLKECEAKRKAVPRNQILGMSYKKTVNHRLMPKLKIPVAMEPQCAVYRALPYYQLEEIANPMEIPEIQTVKKTFNLPPLTRDGYGFRRRYVGMQSQTKPVMGHLSQQLKKSMIQRMSVAQDTSKLPKQRLTSNDINRGSIVTTPTLAAISNKLPGNKYSNYVQEAGDMRYADTPDSLEGEEGLKSAN